MTGPRCETAAVTFSLHKGTNQTRQVPGTGCLCTGHFRCRNSFWTRHNKLNKLTKHFCFLPDEQRALDLSQMTTKGAFTINSQLFSAEHHWRIQRGFGPGGHLALEIFFQNHAVCRQNNGKNPILSTHFGLRAPWGQNSTGPPDQNPGSAPEHCALFQLFCFCLLSRDTCCNALTKLIGFLQSLKRSEKCSI